MENKEKKGLHGGARPGAGRPHSKVKTSTVLVSFRLSGEDVERIKALAAAEGATVHAWCQDAVRRAMRV
jgi:predicted DNA binding CopG/RHH family protein